MRSIQRRFMQLMKQPGKSSYVAFAEAIQGQRFSEEIIRRWLKKLVNKDDYSLCDKKDIFKHLLAL